MKGRPAGSASMALVRPGRGLSPSWPPPYAPSPRSPWLSPSSRPLRAPAPARQNRPPARRASTPPGSEIKRGTNSTILSVDCNEPCRSSRASLRALLRCCCALQMMHRPAPVTPFEHKATGFERFKQLIALDTSSIRFSDRLHVSYLHSRRFFNTLRCAFYAPL